METNSPTVGAKALEQGPNGINVVPDGQYEYVRVVPKQYGPARVDWQIQVLPEQVKLLSIRIGGYDVTDLIDPEVKHAALEEFRAKYTNVAA